MMTTDTLVLNARGYERSHGHCGMRSQRMMEADATKTRGHRHFPLAWVTDEVMIPLVHTHEARYHAVRRMPAFFVKSCLISVSADVRLAVRLVFRNLLYTPGYHFYSAALQASAKR